ncbi:MAG: hypothetical protein ACI4JQ_04935 [Ruminococcus sp.]
MQQTSLLLLRKNKNCNPVKSGTGCMHAGSPFLRSMEGGDEMQQEKKQWLPMILMIGIGLFLHLFHWVIYEVVAFSYGMIFFTPLLLCLCYHGFQTDCEASFGYSRKMVFFGTVLIPLLTALLVSGIVFVTHPHLGLYTSNGALTGSLPELVGLYAGRTMLSGIYVLIFSVIDIPLLYWQDRRRQEKESVRLTETDRAEKQVAPLPVHASEAEEEQSV